MIEIGSRVKIKNDLEMLNRIYRKNHEFTIISSSERGWDIQDDNGNVIYETGLINDIFQEVDDILIKRKKKINKIQKNIWQKQ